LQLVLLIGTVGAIQSRRKSKAEPSDIIHVHELYTIPGVTISDFLYEKSRKFLEQGGGALERTCSGSNRYMLITNKQKEQNSEGNGKWVNCRLKAECCARHPSLDT
jgi:hypothetical protein